MHKSQIYVGAIIRNQKGEFLLQKRDNKPSFFPLCWTLFGGKVEDDETPKEAILRELNEELSLQEHQIVSMKKFKSYRQKNGAKQVIFLIITAAKKSELELTEGEKMEFIPKRNLFKRKFAFNIKEVLQHLIKTTKL